MARGTRQYLLNNSTLSGLTAGHPATIDCPVSPEIVHVSDFEYSEGGVAATRAVMEAAWEKLELLLNNNIFGEYLVPDLLKMNDFYGETFVDGFLSLFFTQDYRENSLDAERHAFVPGAYRNPKFRLHLNAGRVAPALKNFLVAEGAGESGRRTIATSPGKGVTPLVRHEVQTIKLTDSGNVPTSFIYDPTTEYIRSLNFEGDNITRIDIKINGVVRYSYRSLTRLNELLKKSRAVAVPQADTWHINFELLGGSVDAIYQPAFKQVVGGQVQQFARDEIEISIYAGNTNDVRLLAEHLDRPVARAN